MGYSYFVQGVTKIASNCDFMKMLKFLLASLIFFHSLGSMNVIGSPGDFGTLNHTSLKPRLLTPQLENSFFSKLAS